MQTTIAGFSLSRQQNTLAFRNSSETSAEKARLVIRIEGNFDSFRLHRAFAAVVAHHEILRTTYERAPGMMAPFQVVNDTIAPDVTAQLEATTAGTAVYSIAVPSLSADRESLCNLFRELVSRYAGEPVPDTLQYADYSAWQAEMLERTDADASAARAWWAERDCAGIPPLALPFQRRAVGVLRDSVPVDIGAANLHTVLAAWQILLWRVTGQAEVVMGRVSSGRNRPDFDHAIGLYEKVVPEYGNFESEMTFGDVILRLQQADRERAACEDYSPSAETVPGMAIGFSADGRPVPRSVDRATFSILRVDTFRPFALELRCTGEGAAELVFDPACFALTTVEQLARRLEIVLTAAPTAAASRLAVMDETERDQIVRGFNNTAADFARDVCIQQLFEECAAANPDSPALRFGDDLLTYAQLNARANRIAHVLRDRGVKANVPVGLLTERSAEMIVAMLGIIKSGGCYVPLAADHPRARLEQQIAEAGAPVVLTQAGLTHFPGRTLFLNDEAFDNAGATNPSLENTPDDLVYVIYTSGSTGVPKGVAVTHRNLVNYSSFILRRLGVRQGSFATVSTLGADLGNTCVFPALLSGGCLHVIGFETSMNAAAYAAYCAKYPIDVLKITPSHLGTLLEGGGADVLPRCFLISGGEALTWGLLEKVSGAGCQVINHYGPTEATIGCCTCEASGQFLREDWAPATVPIGRPVDNAQVYILDRHLQPVPVGTAGELCVGGAGVARGYLNRPEQTAERFVRNPFAEGRIYRTGDLARFLPGGNIEFLGRIDQQVKIRGFRVEPGEIEAALRQLPGVRNAVIVPEDDAAGGRTLVGYITGAIEQARWRALLSETLPDYMLPSRLIRVDELPLTANGKIDVRALAAMCTNEETPAATFAGPRTPDEERMTAVWVEVLKADRIGIHDNFFDLGGHSLLATQIIARIRKAFGKQVPLHVFLQTPTIAEMTARLADYAESGESEASLARILEELEGISEEEAEALLAAETGDQRLAR